MSNTNDLKPCPFCGAPPIEDGKSDSVLIRCESCGAKASAYYFDGENYSEIELATKYAIEAWNRRPSAKVETPLKKYMLLHGLVSDGETEAFEMGGVEVLKAHEVDALLASQAARGEAKPVAYGVFDKNGNAYNDPWTDKGRAENFALAVGADVVPLYTHSPVDQGLREALRDFMAVSVCGAGFKTAEQHEAYWRAHEKAVAALTPPTGKKD